MRARREKAGFTAEALSRRLGWSTSQISRVETGRRGIDEVEVIHHLASCGAPYQEIAELLAFHRETAATQGRWLIPHPPQLGESIRSLIFHESRARASHTYEPVMVPGLLQTEDYARAVIGTETWRSREDLALCLRTRIGRQALLRKPGADFNFLIHEHALRTPVGGPATMHEQMLHLLFATSSESVRIRIVPRRRASTASSAAPSASSASPSTLPWSTWTGTWPGSSWKTLGWLPRSSESRRASPPAPWMRDNLGSSSPTWQGSTTEREAMRMPEWRKSSRSGGGNSDCVEVAFTPDAAVRDSKNQDGPQLAFPATGWRQLTRVLKHQHREPAQDM